MLPQCGTTRLYAPANAPLRVAAASSSAHRSPMCNTNVALASFMGDWPSLAPSPHGRRRRVASRAWSDPAGEGPEVEEDDEDDDDIADLDAEELAQLGMLRDSEASGPGAHDDPDVIIWQEYMDSNIEGVESRDEVLGAPSAVVASAPPEPGAIAPLLPAELAQLPGLRRRTEPQRVALFGGDTLALHPGAGPRTDWDLRAGMEKKRRMEAEHAAWQADKARSVGRYRSVGADWRRDKRIRDTGNPVSPRYHEWTLREVWDMIAMEGVATDPRRVPVRVHEPASRTDFVAAGYAEQPEIPEWLAERGQLIEDEDVDEVADRDAELALLSSEFSDFDDFAAPTETATEPDEAF